MKRQLNYCDVSDMSTEEAKALTEKMRRGYSVKQQETEWVGRGSNRHQVTWSKTVATYPPLELLR